MAATHTVLSLLYQVRLAVNDLTAGGVATAGQWLSDNDYNGFIARGFVSDETSYTFRRKATGLWIADADLGGMPFALKFASDTAPFTPTGDTGAYVSDCFGNIRTTATDTTATYTVTAAKFDFAFIMSELFFWLAQHRPLQIAQANGAYPTETTRLLMDASGYWSGIRNKT